MSDADIAYTALPSDGEGGAPLLVEKEPGGLLYITLNRPTKLNALNAAMLSAMDRAFDQAEEDEETRVIVLRGAGRAFSAGNDHGRADQGGGGVFAAESDPLADRLRLERYLRRVLRIWEFPKPVIAQVHGYCLGAACLFATMSDLTIVSDDCEIGDPRYLIGGGFVTPSWVHLVGPKRAKEISYGIGNYINGVTAASWGWANRSVPAESLEAEVRKIAEGIARVPAAVLSVKKAAINRMVDVSGFRSAVMACADMDTIAHLGTTAERDLVRTVGLAEAVRRQEGHNRIENV
jgi:enoyl-CoA hydratase